MDGSDNLLIFWEKKLDEFDQTHEPNALLATYLPPIVLGRKRSAG